ncbi:unnamed protein product [Parascedosporium putredinis]|uniref:Probable beta-glucosidase F n=1 Tax=Parascedosporium putredinis TaxID=1442378 RepID=A0A9P1M856_9PEZI|nr:unnamed protein product [Parascedosporium putredinis]CAI7988348.1 unnamed protein product [Parascedosporium putredinis]
MPLPVTTQLLMGAGRCVGNTGSAERVGFPQLCLGDAANGVRLADLVTVFPAGITTGATWDKSLMYDRAVAMGKEFRGKGINIYLGPSVGPLGRKPKGGRNWEGFGSDPVLQAIGGALTIQGVQEQGVIATMKHFIGNEQEMYRMFNPFQSGYSSNIGFQGFVMSDWLSHMSGVGSALAGLDMNMPGDTQVPLFGYSYWMYDLTRSVLNGSVPIDRLNDMATRIVATWYRFGQNEDFPPPNFSTNTRDREGDLYSAAWPFSPRGVVNEFVDVQADHHLTARQVAQDAITLLKNDDSLLPLTTARSIKVFGTGAQTNPDGPNACSDRNCNKGTLGQGWGSGTVEYPYLDSPIDALKLRVKDVTFYNTDKFPSVPTVIENDVAIVFLTSDSGKIPKYKNVVVVVHTVGPLILDRWHDLPSVKAILFAHLPGQEAGESLTNILFGDVSPSGHLPYSITKQESDFPNSITTLVTGSGVADDYVEGFRSLTPSGFNKIFRYIYSWLQPDEAKEAVEHRKTRKYDAYPVEYSTQQKSGPRAGGGEGGNPALWDTGYKISVTVQNSGTKYSGKAVLQAYIQFPDGIPYDTPIIQLRDFAKTRVLRPGESQTLELRLTRKDLSVWDVEIQDWVIPEVDGRFKIWIGESSDRLTTVCYTDKLDCELGAKSPVS